LSPSPSPAFGPCGMPLPDVVIGGVVIGGVVIGAVVIGGGVDDVTPADAGATVGGGGAGARTVNAVVALTEGREARATSRLWWPGTTPVKVKPLDPNRVSFPSRTYRNERESVCVAPVIETCTATV
jgi:hypothetical protein